MLVDSGGEAGFSATAPNSDNLPYSARYEGWRLYLRIAGYGCGIALAAFFAYATLNGSKGETLWLSAAISVIAMAYCAVQLWRLRQPLAVFYSDRVEKPGVLSPAVLHRARVKGVGRLVRTRYGSYFDIVSNSPAEPDIRLEGFLREHPIVADWLQGASDPEAEAKKSDRARVLADQRYGATESERERRLKWVNGGVIAFNIGCAAFAAWLWFWGDLNQMTLLLAFAPVLAGWGIVAGSQELVVWGSRGTARPQVIGALAPPLALAAHAGFDAQMVETSRLVVACAVIALTAAVLLYRRLGAVATRLQSAIFLGALVGAAAYGLALAVDVSLDHSPPQVFPATVTDKRVSRGKSTHYYLDLTSWSDRPAGEMSVSSAIFDEASVGSSICVARHRGALWLAWLSVGPCPPGTDLRALRSSKLKTANEYLGRGNQLLDDGDMKAALADFEKAAALDPASSLAFADIAVAQAWLGNDAEAQSNAAKALGLDPRQHVAFHALAMVSLRKGETSEALANLDRALAVEPRDLFALNRRMSINQAQGKPEDALKDSDAIIALGEDSSSLRSRRAALHLARNDGRLALAEADAWIASHRDDPYGYVIRGGVLGSLDRVSEAEAAFDRALKVRPTPDGYVLRARFRSGHNLPGVKEDLDAALALEPDATSARLLRGEYQVRAGRRDAAVADFNVVRKANARNAQVMNNLCYSQAAADISLDRALQDCETALALSPQTASYIDSKGFVLFRLGRYDEAIATLSSALAINPTLAPSLFTRGLAEMRANQTREGALDLAAASTLDPNIDKQFAQYGVRP